MTEGGVMDAPEKLWFEMTPVEQGDEYLRMRSKAERLRATLDGLGKAHEPTVGLLGMANKCQCEWHRKWRALVAEKEKIAEALDD